MRALAFAEVGGVSGGYNSVDDDFYRPYLEPTDPDGNEFRLGAVRNVSKWVAQSAAWDLVSSLWKSGNNSPYPYGTTDGPGSTSDAETGSDRGG